MRSNSAARRRPRGAAWVETLALTALAFALVALLQGFGGTLAQTIACAAHRIQTGSENARSGSLACADARATSKQARPAAGSVPQLSLSAAAVPATQQATSDSATEQDRPTAEQLF